MPDKRSHRGPHPEDGDIFAPEHWPQMRQAVSDLSWLLQRGYTVNSGLKLVGDRYQLLTRQRIAVMRCACSDKSLIRRKEHQLEAFDVRGQGVLIDGYNLLTTVEAALSGGVLILGRDGCLRDMASMHGSYRKVSETRHALELIGQMIERLGILTCWWYLDRPVSNSGRLKKIVDEIAAGNGWAWQVEIVQDPDKVLIDSGQIVVSADSVILDQCDKWFNIGAMVVEDMAAEVIDLSLSD